MGLGLHVGGPNDPMSMNGALVPIMVFLLLHFGVIFRPALGFQGCYSFEADQDDPSF